MTPNIWAMLNLNRFGLNTTVLVELTSDSQRNEALNLFETGIVKCPSASRCF